MIEIQYKVADSLGIHARPAARLSMEAMKFQCHMEAECGRAVADVKNVIDIMGLGAVYGSQVKFRFNGIDEEEASIAMKLILSQL